MLSKTRSLKKSSHEMPDVSPLISTLSQRYETEQLSGTTTTGLISMSIESSYFEFSLFQALSCAGTVNSDGELHG